MEPLGPDFTMDGKIDPVTLKNTAHEFVEDIVLSQMDQKQLMGLNMGEMTAQEQRLETSEKLLARRSPKV